jgi:uncharacterized protein YlxW (UPF0749 family)
VPKQRVRARYWQVLVPVICLVAGIGFATSHSVSRGTDLRPPDTGNLVDSVRGAENRVHDLDAQVRTLQAQVNAAQKAAGRDNSGVAAVQRKVAPLQAPAGLTAVHGPGMIVILDDASSSASSSSAGVDPNQLVVHQSDLQAVVNALWAGGAEAMSIAGQRVIPTSAVRCVGNTLLLNGNVYSPPFRVAAIGPAESMQQQLDESPGVKLFRDAAGYYGLGYTVETADRVEVPSYRGSITVEYGRATK